MDTKDLSGIDSCDFAARQHVLDVEKWLASERAGRDLCGAMAYCRHCRRGETYPCAKAELRHKMRLALEEIEAEEPPDLGESGAPSRETADILREECAEEMTAAMLAEGSSGRPSDPVRAAEEIMGAPVLPEGYERVTRYRRTFLARLIQNGAVQDLYTELKNVFGGYAGVKSRLCQSGEVFRAGRRRIAKLCIRGKTLVLYLALDPQAFEESKYRFSDASEKKSYAKTPMKVRITGSRSLRQAKELVGILAERLSLGDVGCAYTDYHYPPLSDECLLKRGLIKPYTAIVKRSIAK